MSVGDWPVAPADPWDPGWAEVAALWHLEPGHDHLNNGSFGAVPRPVLEAQASWRDRMERNPVSGVRGGGCVRPLASWLAKA